MALACIIFERGTLCVRGLPRLPQITAIPGVAWENEAAQYRAPVRAYLALVTAFFENGIQWLDQPAPDAGWLSELQTDLPPIESVPVRRAG
jgi:hypothetical protein